MSLSDFTAEEIREYEEIAFQKKKEEMKQFIERGLPISSRHLLYQQLCRERDLVNPLLAIRQSLPAIAAGSDPEHYLHPPEHPNGNYMTSRDHPLALSRRDWTNGYPLGHSSNWNSSFANTYASSYPPTQNQGREQYGAHSQIIGSNSMANNSLISRPSPIYNLRDTFPLSPRRYEDLQIPRFETEEKGTWTRPDVKQSRALSSPANNTMLRAEKGTHYITMHSPKNGQWHGLAATLDSGTEENWIAQKIVDRLRLQVTKGLLLQYETFSSQEISSDTVVKSTWCTEGHSNTHECVFRVIEKAPFDVLFGRNLLYSAEIRWFCDEAVSEPLLVLAQKKVTEKEEQEIKRREQLAKAETASLAKKSRPLKREVKGNAGPAKASSNGKDAESSNEIATADAKKKVRK